MRRKFIATFVMSLLAAALFAAPSFAVGSGELARDIVLTDMSGKQVSLDSFKGKTVVLNFWATWCPPCRGEMPEFDELNKEFQKTGEAVLLAVNLTDGKRETPERVAEFLRETGYTMTVLLDEKQEAASFFGVRYIPTTFILDKDGRLAGQIQGATTKDAVLELLRKAEK
ncbi:TlpA disulfide reductase family protein [uncultured Cloacibacillus sp.]|uniref:TlpA family protein disulfide reductase n=1 Tax=uncultured Cloacibacillus sp. TaxID=889794 RepID=UPI0026DBCB8D|nr:TlpA disulfide reductase family protein [uncultured Cloacibacillus sp.]